MHEAVRSASSAEEAVGLIGKHIEDYLNGGPDKEAENIELGERHGLNLANIKSRWTNARAQRAAVEAPKPIDASDDTGITHGPGHPT